MSVQVQHRRDSNVNIEAVTPAVAELGYDTTKKEALIGDGATVGGVRLQKKNIGEILIAAQITANQNDYNPAGLKHAATLVISTDTSRNITGIVPSSPGDTTDGRELTIYNAGSFNAVLQDQNAASSAANRMDLGGADVTLGAKQSLTLRYRTQGALNRWEIKARTDGQAPADGAISARKLAASALGGNPGMVNGTIVESHTGNAATFALKTLAGTDPSVTDPVLLVFPDSSGAYALRTVTAALSLVISSGSSMGFSSGVPGRLWGGFFDDAGTVRMWLANCSSATQIFPICEDFQASSTAEGGAGAADNAGTIYTGVAVTSKFMIMAFRADYDSGLASAGAWAASPSRLMLLNANSKRPGDIVQSQCVTTGTSTNTTSGSFQSTALSTTWAMKSAVNLLRAKMAAICEQSTSGAGVLVQLFRDTTAFGSRATIYTTIGALVDATLSCHGYDKPGTVANVTVQAKLSSTSGVRVDFNNSGAGATTASMEIEELMG